MAKPSREEAEKLVGKRTALPGAGQRPGANWDKKTEQKQASKGVDFLNPRAVNAAREKEAGMKKGGMAKRKK